MTGDACSCGYGTRSHPVYEKPRRGEVRHSLADISKARGYRYDPKYGVKEGLKKR